MVKMEDGKNREEATQNYADIFLCHNSDEDIMVQYYDYVNHNSSDFQLPRVGLFNSPNGFHGWVEILLQDN